MLLASWNVNSLRVRISQLIDWVVEKSPDVVCLQETKVEDSLFPIDEFQALGYESVFFGQKSYNGVAIISKRPLERITFGNPLFDDSQKRIITATVDDVRIMCVYVPNGQQVGSEKYLYKLDWLASLEKRISEEIKQSPKMVILGDFNIAPSDQDVYDPVGWKGKILCSEKERAAFESLLSLGFKDAFRLFDTSSDSFTWWDYRLNGFKRGLGLRIDHILVSKDLEKFCKNVVIEKKLRGLERPSDHALICADIS